VKLRYLDAMTAHKRSLAEIYFEHLPQWLNLPRQLEDEYDVFHIFGVRHTRRDELRNWLLSNGIKTEIHYPIAPHRQKAMQGILSGEHPIADILHATELSLPISVGHTIDDIKRICETAAKFNTAH
jgi:dTDP-4-amino-4,6-dideoxygalactose transaminase